MDMSKVKRALLRSGVPLEASVVKRLAELGVSNWNEIVYERNGKIFSTDLEINKSYDISRGLGFIVDFVIECKYKEENHCWFFMEFQKGPFHFLEGPPNAVFGDLIDPFLARMGHRLESKRSSWKRFASVNLFDAMSADRGVEIITNKGEFDPNVIKRAVSQAIHGSIVVHGRNIESVSISMVRRFHQERLHGVGSIGFMTVPIVVTTSKLFRLRNNTLMEDIKDASNILDLSEETSSVLLSNARSSFKRFSEEVFKKENIQCFYKAIDLLGDPSIGENPSFHYNFPRNLYVLNYDHFGKLISSCLGKIEKIREELTNLYLWK